MSARPVSEPSGAAHLVVASMQDVTALRDAVKARDEVLSIVAHDMRTPMAAIQTAAWLVRASALDAQTLDPDRLVLLAETIVRAVKRATRMMDDLVDLASIEARKLAVVPALENVATIVAEVTAGIEPLASHHKIHLREDVGPVLPTVRADHDRLVQVLTNLVDNALKVTSAGGEVIVCAEAVAGGVLLTVEDAGPGLDAEERTRVFERYWRGRGARYRGTGLGLAIAKALVEAHGGHIWAEPRREGQRGTRFCVELPAADGAAPGPSDRS